MERCINPDCACEGYKQPSEAKGTLDLLLLRRSCRECGHMSSEHRVLTSVDMLICKEVGASGSRGCVHSIPVMDIPRSPVFGSHDPIHLPWGDLAQDCSVVCACTGFVPSNLVAIQQSFQGSMLSKVREDLQSTLCSFCRHPLSEHKGGGDPAAVTNGNSDVHILGRLKFKSLSQLHNIMATPFTLNLDHKNRRFIVICLNSSSEIVALISNWDTETGINNPVAIDTLDSVPMDTTKDVAIETPKKPKKGRAKRMSTGGISAQRKSVRLEARRIAASEEDSIKEQTKESAEMMVPTEGTTRFMSELREPSKWRKLGKLPELLTDPEPASILCCCVGSGLLLLAVACQSGGAVGLVPGEGEMVWSTLEQNNNYTCASLAESPDGAALVAMGTDRGEVIVWQVNVEQMNVSTEFVGKLQDCLVQITVLKWAPSGKLLAVGCFHGDVLLYSYNEDGLTLFQRMSVCWGTVTTATWSEDNRLLAIGGSDDCVQMLVAPSPDTKSPIKLSSTPSLFNYFPRLSGPQFQHTLTLKGHQSFISDLLFTSSGRLLSLGWDGQLLMWSPTTHPHPHTVDSDPVGGFKIGPSLEAQFLPLCMTAVSNGLLVTIRDKKSLLSVIQFS